MDLRDYYSRVREAKAGLSGENVVMVSLATPEGGKAGVRTETPRSIAARLIVEGRARVATEEEATAFHAANQAAKDKHDRQEAARRLQVVVIPHQESQPAVASTEASPREVANGSRRQNGRKQKDRS